MLMPENDRYAFDLVIPVYNGAAYLERALRSVAAQDELPASIIVIDDGSTDASAEIVKNFASPVPLRYHYKENGGLSSARNAGIALCTSNFIAFLDADDEWLPHKLSRQMALFRSSERENLGAVYCRYQLIDEQGKACDETPVEPDPANRGYIFERLLDANRITGSGSGIVVKRECFQRAGSFDERLRACEDWDMWLRIAELYEFDFVPEILVRIRRHGDNMQVQSDFMFANMLTFYDKWSEAALRHGRQADWGNSVTWRIARDLPDARSLRMARRMLSPQTRRRLFPGGSLLLSMLANGRSILILFAQRLLGREQARFPRRS